MMIQTLNTSKTFIKAMAEEALTQEAKKKKKMNTTKHVEEE
jgi:hypothetical protein